MLRNRANWLKDAVTPGPLGRGLLVLAPVVLAAVCSGQATWLQAVAVTRAVATAAALVEWRHLGNGQWVI